MTIKIKRAAFAGALLFIACNSAFAQIAINVGVPGPAVFVGWHGDRYYDGHRYWGRDEWNHRHPPHRGWHGGPHRGPDRGHGGGHGGGHDGGHDQHGGRH